MEKVLASILIDEVMQMLCEVVTSGGKCTCFGKGLLAVGDMVEVWSFDLKSR